MRCAFAIESFEEANHHDAEILAGSRDGVPIYVIEAGASGFAERIKLGVVENFVEPS